MDYCFKNITYTPNTKPKQREVALYSKDSKESTEYMCNNPCHQTKRCPRDLAECEYQGQIITPKHKSVIRQGAEMTHATMTEIIYKQNHNIKRRRGADQSRTSIAVTFGSRLILKPRPILWDITSQGSTARSVRPKSATHGY